MAQRHISLELPVLVRSLKSSSSKLCYFLDGEFIHGITLSKKFQPSNRISVQIFLSPPVVLLSFISRYALVQQQIESNTTGLQRKIWSSCSYLAVNLMPYDIRLTNTTGSQKKNLDGTRCSQPKDTKAGSLPHYLPGQGVEGVDLVPIFSLTYPTKLADSWLTDGSENGALKR